MTPAAAVEEFTRTSTAPPVPTRLEDTGLAPDQLEQLLVKHLYGGELTGLMLANRLRLPFGILEPIIERLRNQQMFEVRGTTGTSSASYRYALTDLGRSRALQYLEINTYAGVAPVPLATATLTMSVPASSSACVTTWLAV